MYLIDISKLPDCNMFGRMVQTNGWNHNGNISNCDIIVIVVEGEATFQFNNKTYDIKKGEMVIIPKKTFYKVNTNHSCDYFFAHYQFDLSFVLAANKNEFSKSVNSFSLPKVNSNLYIKEHTLFADDFETVLKLMVECQRLMNNATNLRKAKFNLLMTQVLIISDVSYNDEKKYEFPSKLNKIICYISENYRKNITLTDLQDEFSVSKSYIARLFKNHLSTTSSEYINSVKMSHAVELLLHSEMNVTEISNYLGFNDCFYFSRIFKKHFLLSPTMYKNRS